MNIAYHLVSFGPNSAPPTRDLTRLHESLLAESAVAAVGQRFMERFYYSILPREGLIFGVVAYVDGRPAGFVVATDDSAGFMRAAVRRWWPYVGWLVATSILRSPKSMKAVWDVCYAIRKRALRRLEARGEILSLGVCAEYRTTSFMRHSGLRISNDLLDHAVAQLAKRGVCVVRALVNAENIATKLFYCERGWSLSQNQATDWNAPTVEFVWRG